MPFTEYIEFGECICCQMGQTSGNQDFVMIDKIDEFSEIISRKTLMMWASYSHNIFGFLLPDLITR